MNVDSSFCGGINTTEMNFVNLEAKTALENAKDFRTKLKNELSVKTGFNLETLETMNAFPWLPKVVNLNNDEERQQHFEHLKSHCSDVFASMHENLQILTDALQAIVDDYELSDTYSQSTLESLKTKANMLLGLTRNMLEELQGAMKLNNMAIPDKKEEYIPKDYQNLYNNKTQMPVRDWVVLREYMKVIEYTSQVSEHLYKASPSA